MNLQISLGKTNALESHKSEISMSKEWIGLTKDHGKVTSLVATKEHVTLRHAWHESKKGCEKKLWKNAPISSLGYRAFYISFYFLQKPRSLVKISEHFFTIFSHNLFFDSCQAWRRVTCSFVATNDVTFPWSFVRPIHSLPIEISDLCDSRALVFPRLICRFIFKGQGGVPAFSGLLKKFSTYTNMQLC